jgi:hypothetical protein
LVATFQTGSSPDRHEQHCSVCLKYQTQLGKEKVGRIQPF